MQLDAFDTCKITLRHSLHPPMSSDSPLVELNLGNLFKKRSNPKPMADRDAAGLPYTDKDHIKLLQEEYEAAAQHGGKEAIEKCFKCVVHSILSLVTHTHTNSHTHTNAHAV